MRRAFLLFLAGIVLAGTTLAGPPAVPPVATKKAHVTVTHGDSLYDSYFWMREKENPDVVRYLEGENAYVDAVIEPTKPLQEQLYTEMLARIKETDVNVPYR